MAAVHALREERSLLVSTERAPGQTNLSYTLREPFVSEPGERFEIAINSVTFPNDFDTTKSDRRTLHMQLYYDPSYDINGGQGGEAWLADVTLEFPVGQFSAAEICARMNRSLELLFAPLVNFADLNATPTPITAYQWFCEPNFKYLLDGVGGVYVYGVDVHGASVTPVLTIDLNNFRAPHYAIFFKLPQFQDIDGKMAISLDPQWDRGYYPPPGVVFDDNTGFFYWQLVKVDPNTLVTIDFTHDDYPSDVLLPCPNLRALYIATDREDILHSTNLAPFLGLEGVPAAKSLTPLWLNVPHYQTPLTLTVSAFEFYKDVPEMGWNFVNEDAFTDAGQYIYVPFDVYLAPYYTLWGYSYDPFNLAPFLFQIASPLIYNDQEIVGALLDQPSNLLLSVPIVSTRIDERLTFSVTNRVFYRCNSTAIRTIPLFFYVDGEAVASRPKGMPFFVELHIRRWYDPSSDDSRANVPIRADPFLGFRGFQDHDPSKLLLPPGTITHR